MTTPEPPPARRPEVAQGMAAARERGVRLGRPEKPVPPSARRAAELRDQGLSLAGIAEALSRERVLAPSGKRGPAAWTKSSVQYVLRRYDDEHADGGEQQEAKAG